MRRGGFLAGVAAAIAAATVKPPWMPRPFDMQAALDAATFTATVGLPAMLAYSEEMTRDLLRWQMLNLQFNVPRETMLTKSEELTNRAHV